MVASRSVGLEIGKSRLEALAYFETHDFQNFNSSHGVRVPLKEETKANHKGNNSWDAMQGPFSEKPDR